MRIKIRAEKRESDKLWFVLLDTKFEDRVELDWFDRFELFFGPDKVSSLKSEWLIVRFALGR